MLERVADAGRDLHDVRATRRILGRPVVVACRRTVLQLCPDDVNERLAIEAITRAGGDHVARQPRGRAIQAARQPACAFGAPEVLRGKTPRSAEAGVPTDSPVGVLVVVEAHGAKARARLLAVLFVLEAPNVEHDAL